MLPAPVRTRVAAPEGGCQAGEPPPLPESGPDRSGRFKQVAWLCTLPLPPRGRVLFVGDVTGAGPRFLALLGHEVTLLPTAVAAAGTVQDGIGRRAASGSPPERLTGTLFDAIVVSEPSPASLVGADTASGTPLSPLLGLLKDDGVIWYGAGTRRGCALSRQFLGAVTCAWRRGMTLAALYEMYPSLQRPFEMFSLYGRGGRGLLAIEGRGAERAGLKGCLKRRIPGWLRALCFSPGLGALLTGQSSSPHGSFLTGLVLQVAQGACRIDRMIFGNPDTLILLFQAGAAHCVLKMPLSRCAAQRCEVNLRALGDERLRERLAGKLPGLVATGSYRGFAYYIEEKKAGVAVDSTDYPVRELVGQAARFLLRFNRQSAVETTLDRARLDQVLGGYIELLRDKGDSRSQALLSWCSDYLRENLLGLRLPLVYLHGDYKLENVLVDPEGLEVTAVIDWDLAKESFFPLVDLFHLLAYQRYLLHSVPLERSVLSWWQSGAIDGEDGPLFEEFLNQMSLDRKLCRPLLLVYWLHHLCERVDHAYREPAEFAASFNELAAQLREQQ